MSFTQFNLPPDLQQFVDHQVNSGKYSSSVEVVHEALKVFREHERVRQSQVDELRSEIQIALDELDRGEGERLDIEAIKRELRTKLQQASRSDR